jgi:hypothetical protein
LTTRNLEFAEARDFRPPVAYVRVLARDLQTERVLVSRLMGASVKTIDNHYGHLVRDAEDSIRVRLEARSKPKAFGR